MSTLVAWIDSGQSHEEPPKDVTREEFERIRARQNELMRRVEFVEAQIRALEARVEEDERA